MTIHRKIFKVKTQGSRAAGNLRPGWEMAEIMPGVSTVVYEYNEAEGWCICECWVSDHPSKGHPRNKSDLDSLATNPLVIEVLTSYPLSPPLIGRLAISDNAALLESIDEKEKKIKLKNKAEKMSFKRKFKEKDTGGKEHTKYVLDEG